MSESVSGQHDRSLEHKSTIDALPMSELHMKEREREREIRIPAISWISFCLFFPSFFSLVYFLLTFLSALPQSYFVSVSFAQLDCLPSFLLSCLARCVVFICIVFVVALFVVSLLSSPQPPSQPFRFFSLLSCVVLCRIVFAFPFSFSFSFFLLCVCIACICICASIIARE